MDDFLKHKGDCLSKVDKSNKGAIDEDVVSLCDLINSHDDYYTTSSCSGRIQLIQKLSESKKDVTQLSVEHGSMDAEAIRSLDFMGKLWFKQEPLILHVACRNMDSATKLLSVCHEAGFKRAGIISTGEKIVMEIIGTDQMDALLGRDGKILCTSSYLDTLVAEGNNRLNRNRERIKILEETISRRMT